MIKKFKWWLLSKVCPHFYEDMPKEDKQGRWEVGAITFSPWHSMERGTRIVEGSLIDAYIEARKIAWREDNRTARNTGSNELGVQWFVRLIKD